MKYSSWVALASSDRQVLAAGEGNRCEIAAQEAFELPYLDLLPTILAVHSGATLMHFLCDGHWTAQEH